MCLPPFARPDLLRTLRGHSRMPLSSSRCSCRCSIGWNAAIDIVLIGLQKIPQKGFDVLILLWGLDALGDPGLHLLKHRIL
mmetsp:Transcript_43642/g.95443  ORF Transcript_43642/g.95443 Transcript_43642/m.95443 type:complete len:81 (-) Transcript_43642:32-274(-)